MDLKNLKVYSESDFPSYLPKLNALYDDLFSGGKGFRSKLVNTVCKHLDISDQGVQLLAQTIEFIHNASLLHDDLIDRSHLRRNKTTAWLKYTPEYAVLAGDYLLARVMANLATHGNCELLRYTSETISNLLEGEWIQDSLVRDWDIQLEQLDRVHTLKTASLFRWCLKAPFCYAERETPELKNRLDEMGRILGQLFQRSDDLLDFDIRNYENKAVLGDLKSGYLNSFGVYLSQDLSPEKKKKMIQSQSMADLMAAIGESEFERRCHDFDNENIQLIDLYKHLTNGLKSDLNPSEHGLVDDLINLSDWLYWRRKS